MIGLNINNDQDDDDCPKFDSVSVSLHVKI
jgi:hypothetical protein